MATTRTPAELQKLADYLYEKMGDIDYETERKFLISKLSTSVFGKDIDLEYDDFTEALNILMYRYNVCLMITEFSWQIITFRVVRVARMNSKFSYDYIPKKEDIPEEWINGLAQMVSMRIIDVIKYTNAESTTLYWKDIEYDLEIKIPGVVKTKIGEAFSKVKVKTDIDDISITIYANRSSLVNPDAVATC